MNEYCRGCGRPVASSNGTCGRYECWTRLTGNGKKPLNPPDISSQSEAKPSAPTAPRDEPEHGVAELVERLEAISTSVRLNGAAHVVKGTRSPYGDTVALAALKLREQDHWRSEYLNASRDCSELAARLNRAEEALTEIADGRVGPEQAAHYHAHRKAVKLARQALQGPHHG